MCLLVLTPPVDSSIFSIIAVKKVQSEVGKTCATTNSHHLARNVFLNQEVPIVSQMAAVTSYPEKPEMHCQKSSLRIYLIARWVIFNFLINTFFLLKRQCSLI